ncbi:cytochrome P450 736A117-like [Cornus florida]|uniref:cytochrome P450 736A117-like n=1 Tax=Cornus florida TaxID=4283 RepID=UPI00289B2472|nr:cytochrome P450 736A117-like [Cornus florida]
MLFLFHSFYTLLPLFFPLVFLLKWFSNPKTKTNLPPSPSKLPIIGNLHQLGLFPHRSLQSLAQKYGSLMLLHLGSKPVLIASSAEAASEILKTNDLVFSTRPKSSIASRLFYGKDIAFVPYGEYWRQVRSICVHNLLNNKTVQSFHTVREEETTLLVEKIKRSSSSSSSPVNLTEMLISLTSDVVCRIALGVKYSERGDKKLKELFGEFMELLGVFDVGDYIPWLAWLNHLNGLNAKVERVANELDKFMEAVVEEHIDSQLRKSNGGTNVEDEGDKDFVDVLLRIQRENMSTDFPLNRDSIKAIILDMFTAGTDTTYTALEWTMTELFRHPKVMKKLQNEVREIAKGKEDITEDDLEKMHYLKAVMKESMRLHTPAPLLIPRESTQDVKVMGYDIAAGTQVFINASAIGRDPSLWEDTNEFLPERFLNTSIDYKGQDFQLIPFGSGRRGCPGTLFAMTLNELAVAKLVLKFDFALPNGTRGLDLDMTEVPGITIQKKHPLLVVANPCSC